MRRIPGSANISDLRLESCSAVRYSGDIPQGFSLLDRLFYWFLNLAIRPITPLACRRNTATAAGIQWVSG